MYLISCLRNNLENNLHFQCLRGWLTSCLLLPWLPLNLLCVSSMEGLPSYMFKSTLRQYRKLNKAGNSEASSEDFWVPESKLECYRMVSPGNGPSTLMHHRMVKILTDKIYRFAAGLQGLILAPLWASVSPSMLWKVWTGWSSYGQNTLLVSARTHSNARLHEKAITGFSDLCGIRLDAPLIAILPSILTLIV